MKYKFLLFFCLNFAFIIANGHNTKEAYFTIEKKANYIKVDAEFPWTIRKALLAFKPELSQNKGKVVFEKAFFDYVQSCFIIKDKNDKQLKLIRVEQLNSIGHDHQTNYAFYFEYGEICTITNTLLLNINEAHINYHTLLSDENSEDFNTTLSKKTHQLKNTSTGGLFWAILVIMIVALLIIYKIG